MTGDRDPRTTFTLPAEPEFLWKETRRPWHQMLLTLVLWGVDSPSDRQVAISVNGLSLRRSGTRSHASTRFVPWSAIDDIVAAPGTDLAIIRLHDRTSITLDRWHVPSHGQKGREEKARRIDLLRSALAASRSVGT